MLFKMSISDPCGAVVYWCNIYDLWIKLSIFVKYNGTKCSIIGLLFMNIMVRKHLGLWWFEWNPCGCHYV